MEPEQAEVERLVEEGLEALTSLDFARARKIGRRIIKLRNTWGYEILARAEAADGNMEKATATLQDGVKKAPAAWPLWELLGNCLSDTGQYTEAWNAYEGAMRAPGVRRESILFNMAVVLQRQKRYAEALECLNALLPDAAEDATLWTRNRGLTLLLLNRLGRHDEVLARGDEALPSLPKPTEEEPLSEEAALGVAEIHTEYARALWRETPRTDEAIAHVHAALGVDGSNDRALELLRHIEGARSPHAHRYRLTLGGRWHQPIEGQEEEPEFFTYRVVIADSPEEALQILRRLEPVEIRDGLAIREVEDEGPAASEPKGVAERGGYVLLEAEVDDA